MTAEYKVHGDIAVITLNNPPVNGLGLSTRQAIADGVVQANADAAVKAIIVTGAGKAFSGGADIKEFGSPKALQEPNLLSVILVLENSAKPVVAAIHSVCMGGGLELALGAHYRIAAPGTSVALPEVKLGLVPGAGGTQRLPRVLGVEAALNMIVSGEPVKSELLASLPGQKLFDKLAASPNLWPKKPWPWPVKWPPNTPMAAPCPWCVTFPANTHRVMPTSSSPATWSRAWPRTSRHPVNAWTPSRLPPSANLPMACCSSVSCSST